MSLSITLRTSETRVTRRLYPRGIQAHRATSVATSSSSKGTSPKELATLHNRVENQSHRRSEIKALAKERASKMAARLYEIHQEIRAIEQVWRQDVVGGDGGGSVYSSDVDPGARVTMNHDEDAEVVGDAIRSLRFSVYETATQAKQHFETL